MNTRINFRIVVSLVVLFLIGFEVTGQQIILDKPFRAGELTLFPDLNDENIFYYLPDKPRLATHEDGSPQFSFLRYVENVRTGATEEAAKEGRGGGIVHAVVSLEVTEDQLRAAERALQRQKPSSRIEGPVVYKSGKFTLVSSFKEEDGEFTKKVLGLGAAPILDGQKAAISIQLTKLGAKILWESFKTSTPDISFSFEMDIQGFRLPKRASIEANFDQIYKHKGFNAGVATPYLAAEIKLAFDDLVRDGAIKVEQVGSDDKMEALLATAYNKLTEMMFAPLGGTGTPSLSQLSQMGQGNQSMLDKATRLLNTQNRPQTNNSSGNTSSTGSSTTPTQPTTTSAATDSTSTAGATRQPSDSTSTAPRDSSAVAGTDRPSGNNSNSENSGGSSSGASIAIIASFEMKEVKQKGTFKIDLNKWTSDMITSRFDENIGNLSRLNDDHKHFKMINVDDPFYKQREIVAFIDGSNASDFKDYINFVVVNLKKEHEEGDITNDDVRIDRYNFNDKGNYYKMLYGWKDDNDREKWMEYLYEVTWSFFGDHTVTEEFQSTTFNAINLKPPLQKRLVEVQADPQLLENTGVRLVTVKLFYSLGDQEYTEQVTLNPARQMLSQTASLIVPDGVFDYEYEVNWRLTGNRSINSERLTSSESILFVDELPPGD